MPTKTKEEGTDPQTMEAAIGGRATKQLSTVFPPVWDPEEAGEFLVGVYDGTEEIRPTGVKKAFTSYRIALEAWRGHFVRAKQVYSPTKGELISVSGDVLSRAMEKLKPGQTIGIKFLGLGEKKGKNNPAKLFEAVEIAA